MIKTMMMILAIGQALTATASTDDEGQRAFRDLYKELIEINTTLSAGSCTSAAEAMGNRLSTAGLAKDQIHIIVPPDWPEQGNLVAIYPGTSPDLAPILLLAHIDVVEANPADWERDPFTLIEENGSFFGRGTADDKAMASIFVDVLIRMSQSGYRPDRSIKLALTCGEETPNTFNGVRYLLEHHRDLIDAGFALNEGGMSVLDQDGRQVYLGIQAGEKTYQDYRLEVRNPGGHSSRPVPDNAIYRLSAALGRIASFPFPIEFNGTTRGYFERMSQILDGQVAQDMRAVLLDLPETNALARLAENASYNSILHTTCVATMLDAGHAPNALPQRAGANINCRIFPGHTQEEIRQTLERIIDDSNVNVTLADPPESTSPPPELTAEILAPIEALSQQMWPGIPLVPSMTAGGTDGRFLTPAGISTYGVSGFFLEPDKVHAHGLNENVPVKSLYESREFLTRLVKAYVGGK